jgi:hypothetical protein
MPAGRAGCGRRDGFVHQACGRRWPALRIIHGGERRDTRAQSFAVTALQRPFGAPMRDFIVRRLTMMTALLAAVIVGGFLVLKLL